MTGIVKSMPANKRYGYIREDYNGKEYFFHMQDFIGHWDDLVDDFESVQNHLMAPIKVDFTPISSPKGLRASNVSRIGHPNQAVKEIE